MYAADFRLREYIVQCLKRLVTEAAEPATRHISPAKAALQLALSYSIGFGTARNDILATLLLDQYSLESTDLQIYIQSIKDGINKPSPEDTLFERLYRQHQIRRIDLSDHYREGGLLERAEAVYKREIQNLHQVFGENHELPLILMFWLARIMTYQGRWEDAAELEAQVMETEKSWLGHEDPNMIRSMTHLALLKFGIQGRRNEAEILAVQAAEMGSRVLGPEHPDTLVSIGLLALIYRHQGRLDEAENLETRVMETHLMGLGPEHQDTLTSQSNLAAIFREQRRWEESEQLYIQILETSKKVMGTEHPETLHSMRDLASTYNAQGRWVQAEHMNLQASEALKRRLGPEHRDTLTCQSNLAVIYYNQGRLRESEELNLHVLDISKRVLGPKHPDTLISQTNIVSIYLKQGRLKEAQQLKIYTTDARERRGHIMWPMHRDFRWWKPKVGFWKPNTVIP